MARKTEGPYAHPRQMPHEVKSHFNLNTGGYSIHEHDAGTTEREARAVLLLRSYGHVRRDGHELFKKTKGPVTLSRRWDRVQTGPDEAKCVPSGMLDVPVVLEMGKRSLYAWSVGTRASQAATRAALAEAREGRGGWMPALFDAATGCFAAMGPNGRSAGCLPNDRSVDVLLTLRPNILMPRPPGIDVDLCRSLYYPARGKAWRTPRAFAPRMYYRPAARENPTLPCGSVLGSFRSRKEAEKALRAMQGATGGTLRIVRR